MRKWHSIRLALFLIVLISTDLSAQEAVENYLWPEDSLVSDKLDQWQDWKFGVIIHWGPYSEWGVVESWSLCPEDEPWCQRTGPFSDSYYRYDSAYQQIRTYFNPTRFNPDRWARACAGAGMRYVVFTTKHHDGFCMFDSQYTDYKITDSKSAFSTNPRSNITNEVFKAFRKQNMAIGAYFSKPDWHSENYWWPYFPRFDRNVNYDPVKYPDRWKKFTDYTYNQLQELVTEYGSIDILWLDGGWVRPANSLTEESQPWLGLHQWVQDVDIPAIALMARQNQPGLLIVDRSVHGPFENYRTPEQQIPDDIPDYPWESCITLGPSWYSASPDEQYKSSEWVIKTLVQIVVKGGNLLLGIGPDKSGDLVQDVYQRLDSVGKWMDINGKAIYGSCPVYPYSQGQWAFTQSKDGQTVYAFWFTDSGADAKGRLQLPAELGIKFKSCNWLGNGQQIPVKQDSNQLQLLIPKYLLSQMPLSPVQVFELHGL